MGLKESIERIFTDNTSYTNPNQAVNQASSLNTLSGDLYTDSKRFIYELLQNADDSSENNKSVDVWIKVFDDNLVVAHSGKPFTDRDLQGLCNVNNGTKKSDITKTGYKGIGFKSVFGQSDKVTVFTKDEYFRFDSTYSFEWKWKESQPVWEAANERVFQYPWQIIPIYTYKSEVSESINHFLREINANVATIIKMKYEKETLLAAQNLSQDLNMFLFLKNISKIHFEIKELVVIEIEHGTDNTITLYKGGSRKADWLIRSVHLAVPEAVKISLQDERNIPDKLLSADHIEISLAAKLDNDGIGNLSTQEKLLYSYLPTGETKYSLPVLVNTSFLTTANRESLHADSKWNQWLFKSIAIEIFNWIPVLLNTSLGAQAYQLLPEKTRSDELGAKFNEGIEYALENIPFVASKDGRLIKIGNTIVDFTFLSEKRFIGKELIKRFVDQSKTQNNDELKLFARDSKYFSVFKKLGSYCFEWKDVSTLLSSDYFTITHTPTDNIELIKHLKTLCESEKIKDVTNEFLKKLPFILDHKNNINYPLKTCFPAADDTNWNNPNSELSFLHQDLQSWLLADIGIRQWLASLGVEEKTDITYITQTIIPRIDDYITQENAMQTIRELFNLYNKGSLQKDILEQLSRLKLLTRKGSLYPARDCFLSDYYNPRLSIEGIIDEDVFVSDTYCVSTLDKDEWKRFFKMLGVNEGIMTFKYPERTYKHELIDYKFKNDFFATDNKKFKPFQSTFIADCFSDITTLLYIQLTENNPKFAFKFWSDFIGNYTPGGIKAPAIAYWGHENKPGRTSGDLTENYVPWFVKNINCVPTLSGECKTTAAVFLNTEEIVYVADKYLPVFRGPELSPDWKAFFSFRTSLGLKDYLDLLDKIPTDIDDNGFARPENHKRIQTVYTALLAQCSNWSSDEISLVKEWALTARLLNTKSKFSECNTLKYFLDGNEAVFQDQYCFLMVNAENKSSPNLERFLKYINVTLLMQSEFKLEHIQAELCRSLTSQLVMILPYLKIWIETEECDVNILENLYGIQRKFETLAIFHADELKIKYQGIDFSKNVNVHLDDTGLYVTKPWNSNSVMLKLPEVLCRYLNLMGHDRKLGFLLRANVEEIHEYFSQEEIVIPKELYDYHSVDTALTNQKNNSFADVEDAIDNNKVPLEFYHLSSHDYHQYKYVEKLVERSVENIVEHLKKLPQYDCSHYYKIAKSVLGGITKNGNEVTVIARPSDNEKVLLYYTSEYDVLEYVDAELWCEDGINIPKQITMGRLLKKTGINRIPINNLDIKNIELEAYLKAPKSESFEFNAILLTPQKIAAIVASFANTSGGTLVFGIKENYHATNEIIGLSTDFPAVDITKKALSLLTPIPTVTYNWLCMGDKYIFIIKTEKTEKEVLLDNQKYIRIESDSAPENKNKVTKTILNQPNINKTIAIIISIENYAPRPENQISSVKYATNDAQLFREMLINSMGVEAQDIYMITDDEALKSNLEYEMTGLFNSLTESYRLVFYYVGHGFHNGITNYLSTYDMHQRNIAETAISLRKVLLDPLHKSKCENALIFIDACAQSFKDENERSQITNIIEDDLVSFTSAFPHYAVFLSCHPGESSYSSDILKNGIWTYHLVNAISGNVPEAICLEKFVTDKSLRDYLSSCVPIYTQKELRHTQTPKAILDSSYENIIVEVKKNSD